MLKTLDLDRALGSLNAGMIEHGIFVKRGALENPDKLVQDMVATNQWYRAETFGGVSDHRTNDQIHLTRLSNTTNPELKDYDNQIVSAFQQGIDQYSQINPHLLISQDEGIIILRYSGGEEYKEHVDSGLNSPRILSGLIYLNDNFSGGNLEFPRQKISIRPEPGMLVLFPSCFAYPHIAKPVKKGTRFVAVTWFK